MLRNATITPSEARVEFSFLARFDFEPVYLTIYFYYPWGICVGDCDQFPIIHGERTRTPVCHVTLLNGGYRYRRPRRTV